MQTGHDQWAELQLAYEKALTTFSDRADEVESVFAHVNGMRVALLLIHTDIRGAGEDWLIPQRIDENYQALHDAFYAFESTPAASRTLFAFRSEPVSWPGTKASSLIHCIREAALNHLAILQRTSLYKTLGPFAQMRENNPELWFDESCCQQLAAELEKAVSGELILWSVPDAASVIKSDVNTAIEGTTGGTKQAVKRKSRPNATRMSFRVANEILKGLLSESLEECLEMSEEKLARKEGCARGTLRKTSAFTTVMPEAREPSFTASRWG